MRRPRLHRTALLVCPAVFLALSAAARAERGTVPAPDGVPIAYEVAGAGEPTLVLIHGWSCDRGFWTETVSHFAARHRVVALDLPGHGESGRDRREWTMLGFGADVKALADALGLSRMVLVGHSLGGPVALEAARLLPGRVVGVVGVDTLQNADWKPDRETWAGYMAAYEKDFVGTCGGFVQSMFTPEADPKIVASVRDRMCDAPPEVALPLMRGFPTYDMGAALAAAGVPVRTINAAGFPTDVAANRRHAPDYATLIMDGVGHFLQLERPEEFHHRLASVLAELAGGPPAAATPAAARLADLGWIAGEWREDGDGSLSQEVWTAPSGDSMLGLWRRVRGGRLRVVELLAIVREPAAPTLQLRHFARDFVAWEEKEQVVRLPLVRWAAGEADFEGPGTDGVLVRLHYRRAGEDGLTVHLEHGPERMESRFKRAR